MLCEVYKDYNLERELLPLNAFKIFPKIINRKKWNNIHTNLKKFILRKGEEYLNYNWQILLASEYMAYKHNGNRSKFEKIYFQKRFTLGMLTIAECIENSSTYYKQINILINIKGISVMTTIAIIADIVDIRRFPNSKHFTSYLRRAPGVDNLFESFFCCFCYQITII